MDRLKKLGKLLGLSFADDDTEDIVEAKVSAAIEDLKKKVDEAEKAKVEEEEDEEVAAAAEGEEPKKKDEEIKASRGRRKVDPLLVDLASENRSLKLNKLMAAGKITAEVRDDLYKKYVEKSALALSLRKGGDDFDSIIALFSKNDPVALGEHSIAQTTVALGDMLKGGKNPLLENAKARAAAKSN